MKYGDPNYKYLGLSIPLNQQQHNLIIGSMLGDGHLRKPKDTCNTAMRIKRSTSDIDYLKWQANICNNLVTPNGIVSISEIDKRSGNLIHSSWFLTKSIIELNSYYANWYLNKIKIVPNNLQLNSEIMAIWLCDDGNISIRGKYRFEIRLFTNSFTKDEVLFLIDLLQNRYNENFDIRKLTDKEQHIIVAHDSACRALITDIDSVFPGGMQRKRLWDNPSSCFYSNQPPRIITPSEKEDQVWDFIAAHDEFYLMDVAKHLNWRFTRSDGTIEWDTQNTKRYLKEYVDSGYLSEEMQYEPIRGIKYTKIIL